ncbi:polyprenyl synthetase family protein [Actinotalea sp. C106]|uniref:polyprenyl synthetase family protein n=1 Tax=Actinotalea sp. C106 TaxID=2908644 RepID=UPI002027DA7D|nr:polyprenyl synthetase family protein [Actinotalea sp. C106]
MASSPSSLVDVDQVRHDVDEILADHVAALRVELEHLGPAVTPLVEAVERMLSGGKRLRAAFCYWSWRAHGGSDLGTARGASEGVDASRTAVLRVGAALELFQAAALFHDDVMDDSDTRRGKPSAHRHFAEVHQGAGWAGSARRFGESAAILLGDLSLIASERELALAVAGLPEAARLRVRGVFDRMRTEVTVGQYLDVLVQATPWGEDPVADEERARQVIRAKSARYSVEHPMALGATLAGVDDETLRRCRGIGLPLGEAFQLRDDLLGVFGDPGVTGKPAGDDLREGKRTVLVSRALRGADRDGRSLVLERLGAPDLTAEGIDDLRAVIVRTGADRQVEQLIAELADPALAALEEATLAEPGRSMLVELGRAAVDRQT